MLNSLNCNLSEISRYEKYTLQNWIFPFPNKYKLTFWTQRELLLHISIKLNTNHRFYSLLVCVNFRSINKLIWHFKTFKWKCDVANKMQLNIQKCAKKIGSKYNYLISSGLNRPLARLNIESLLGSYGWSFEGISNIAGTGAVCPSITWRTISATFWLIRIMSISSLLINAFRQSKTKMAFRL